MTNLPVPQHRSISDPSGHSPRTWTASLSIPRGSLGSCYSSRRPPAPARSIVGLGTPPRLGGNADSASHCRLQIPRWLLHGEMLPGLQPSAVPLSGGAGRLRMCCSCLRHWRAHEPRQRSPVGSGCRASRCRLRAGTPGAAERCGACQEVLAGAGLPAPQVCSLHAALGAGGGWLGAGL
ncbi:hypothetical protein Nmel_017791 [Mimus melanotis]